MCALLGWIFYFNLISDKGNMFQCYVCMYVYLYVCMYVNQHQTPDTRQRVHILVTKIYFGFQYNNIHINGDTLVSMVWLKRNCSF